MFGDEVEMDDGDLAEIDALAARHYAKSEAEGLRERCRQARGARPAHQRPLLRGYLADPAEAGDPPRLELYCSHPPPDGLDQPAALGDIVPCYVLRVRDDAKLDLSFRPPGSRPKPV